MWIERKIEGDRLARIRLDAAPLTPRKFALKGVKHAAWLALALWTGYHVRRLLHADPRARRPRHHLAARSVGRLLDAVLRLRDLRQRRLDARAGVQVHVPVRALPGRDVRQGHARHHLRRERGEPRGARAQGRRPRRSGLGDCVDCNICVQVCPTGIDIRNGLQYECIGCAACIDGCDQVMDKMGYPRGPDPLRDAECAGEGTTTRQRSWRRVLRPRTVLYATILIAIAGAATVSLAHAQAAQGRRDPRPRRAGARSVPGVIENVYRLQVMNTDESRAAVHHSRGRAFPGSRSSAWSSPSTSAPRNRACSRCACARRRPTTRPRSPGRNRIRSSSSCSAVGDDEAWRAMRSPRSSCRG